jgi:carboxyl-terminal processing protease
VTAVPHRDDLPNIPLVVLVNQYSASASEIVAGALKDHRRALIVGERTFGKGSVQELFPLADRSAYLKLTTSHYYLPSGRCIHREEDSTVWGVEPDLIISMTPEQMREANRVRQSLDVLHDSAQEGEATVKEQDQLENQLLETDPQLSTALLMLRMRLAGAGVM